MSTTPTAAPPAKLPRQILYIIGNEGCERFSFYGMKNILIVFLSTWLLMFMPDKLAREAHAKDVFHTFVIGVYFFPLLGGWIADKFLGKYNTIFAFSLIYCAGHACLAIFDNEVNGFFVGLFLIALGAGGIKPLVASFMGDQFDSTNKHLAKVVFDAFYWIINFGSFFASMLMPIFLVTLGPSIAFLIPGALMFIATAVLWLGRHKYVMVPVKKTRDPHSFLRVVRTALFTGNHGKVARTIAGVLGIASTAAMILGPNLGIVEMICLALVIVFVFGGIATSAGLENCRNVHPDEAIEGVRSVLRILIVFALVTPFHSLFDQKASTWVLQGGEMAQPSWTLDPTGRTGFQPAQMQMFNPLLVMILIPFNNVVLYPALRRAGMNPTPIRRMTFGILFSAFAWIAAGGIQLALDGGNKLDIMWQLLPYVLLTFGEVLVSATGLEFAYSQAPFAMKGVIMSFWNLTTTIGNLWVLLVNAGVRDKGVLEAIEETGLSQNAFLMFFFAAFAFVATIAFWLYTRRYRPLDNYRAGPGAPEPEDPGEAGPKAPLPTATAREK